MTKTEFVVVICIFCLIFSFLFFYPHTHRGSDKSANILNIRNCQQAMRGAQNMEGLAEGDPFTPADLEEFMKYPMAVNAAIGEYGNAGDIRPESADPAADWNHIWLIPGAAGLPGGEFGHDSYKDVTGW